jgi:hypothetical protein
MKTPIIVSDEGDVLIFESIQAAESYIEPWHLDRLITFDSDGTMLNFREEGGGVKLYPVKEEQKHEEELKGLLKRFLKKVMPTETYDNLNLSQLIIIMSRFSNQ